jgi:hypothetical protein
MGYRYQNKLEEEAERRYWQQAPWWQKLLYRLFMLAGGLLAFYGTVGWVLLKLF